MTLFICHVGYQVTTDITRWLLDGIDAGLLTTAGQPAATIDGVDHAHARARWIERTLRITIEGWVDSNLTVRDADGLGHHVAEAHVTWAYSCINPPSKSRRRR